MGTLTERTRGIDVLNLCKEKFCKINLKLSNLVSVFPDGAPSMIGTHEGFVALLRREPKSRHVDVLSLYFASAKLVCQIYFSE